jgi:hypothetical protein
MCDSGNTCSVTRHHQRNIRSEWAQLSTLQNASAITTTKRISNYHHYKTHWQLSPLQNALAAIATTKRILLDCSSTGTMLAASILLDCMHYVTSSQPIRHRSRISLKCVLKKRAPCIEPPHFSARRCDFPCRTNESVPYGFGVGLCLRVATSYAVDMEGECQQPNEPVATSNNMLVSARPGDSNNMLAIARPGDSNSMLVSARPGDSSVLFQLY